jgi:predicted AAA+ superfamily ATPase
LQSGVKPNQIVALNFEEYENQRFLNDLDALYQHIIEQIDLKIPSYIFLDEIQNVKKFEQLVDGLHVKEHVEVYITRSNAFHVILKSILFARTSLEKLNSIKCPGT